ncbi:MAG: glycosyltransferase family 39 protein [Chloroflexi bacterium]|nr:glycosyltransferase family 39 protein [Chloroflexota bacterium]
MSARQILRQSVSLMLTNFIPGPLYYLVGHLSLEAFGQNHMEFALRLPSVIAGLLAVPVVYALARHLWGEAEGILAALLFAVSPFQVWYSQEARFYAWTTLLSTASTLCILRVVAKESRAALLWFCFIVTSALNLYNQPLPATIVLGSQACYVLIYLLVNPRKARLLGQAGLSFSAVVVLYLPVIIPMVATGYLSRETQSVAKAQHGFFAPGFDSLIPRGVYICSELITKFAAGGASKWLFLALFLIGIGSLIVRRQRLHSVIVLLPFLLALFVFVIARPATGFVVRYVLFLQAWYLVCVARGVTFVADDIVQHVSVFGSESRFVRLGWSAGWKQFAGATLTTVLTLVSLMAVSNGYSQAKISDWRSIANYVKEHLQPGDIVTGSRWFRSALSWYCHCEGVVTFSPDENPELLEDAQTGRRIWYVLIEQSDSAVGKELQGMLHRIPDREWQIPGVDYTPTFFPVSEFPASLLFSGSSGTAAIRFYDAYRPSWTDRSYKEITVGTTVYFWLDLIADNPRDLEITYFDSPRKLLEVCIEDQPGLIIGGGSGGWQTLRLSVPSNVGRVLHVGVTGIGPETGAISATQLKIHGAD